MCFILGFECIFLVGALIIEHGANLLFFCWFIINEELQWAWFGWLYWNLYQVAANQTEKPVVFRQEDATQIHSFHPPNSNKFPVMPSFMKPIPMDTQSDSSSSSPSPVPQTPIGSDLSLSLNAVDPPSLSLNLSLPSDSLARPTSLTFHAMQSFNNGRDGMIRVVWWPWFPPS